MKILFVAMPDSIHTVRWISQLTTYYEVHLFGSYDAQPHAEMPSLIFHQHFKKLKYFSPNIQHRAIYTASGTNLLSKIIRRLQWSYTSYLKSESLSIENSLIKVIEQIKPDIIHSLETQIAGYLTLEAKKKMGKSFPTWVHSNWGNDIYLFARLKAHQERVKEVLANCDFHLCECNRDVKLAKSYGLKGLSLPLLLTTSGGLKIDEITSFRRADNTSQRRIILLKGYNTWAGRGMVGLRALERCADLLKEYQVLVYSNDTIDMRIATELFAQNTGINVGLLPKDMSHKDMLAWHGKARISIGLSISDGVPNAMLEAMALGSFPIQSNTSCAEDWITDGETGLLVPPEDVEVIEQAIRKALIDDELVDTAAEKNYQTVLDRLEYSKVQQKTIQMYEDIYSKSQQKKNINASTK